MTTAYTQGTRVDHYEIIRALGHGGMNWVYLARDVNNDQEVVLKFPNDELIGNIAVYERYKREAEIGNRLHHPQIQQLVNTDEKRSEDYFLLFVGRTMYHKILKLREDGDVCWGPSWSPDSSKIGFSSDRSGHDEVYLMPHKTRRWMKSFKGGAVSHVQQTLSRPLIRNGGVQQYAPQVLSKYALEYP